jgi:hypothetical protein
LFQRPYVWNEEANWEPLWRDVRKAAEDLETEQAADEAPQNPPTYFLGAVVLQERRRPPRRLSSSHIIDGQQRLTTLQVLLAAARAVAYELGADNVAGRYTSLLENRPDAIYDEFMELDRYKVWPLPQDREAFLWAVRRPDDNAACPSPEHLLSRARQWFEAELREWAKAAEDAAQRLDNLHFCLQERMQLVEITLDASDDPQVIFEALNHRGVRLAAADLVKNLLFQTVERQGDGKRAEELLTHHWLQLDAKPWRDNVTTGRIRRVLVDLLLTYWLTVQTEQDVLVEHLFADFKRWLAASESSAAAVIEDLAHYAETYLSLHDLPGTDPTARLLDHMSATNTTTPWPVLLYLHANTAVPSDQRDAAAAALESFLVRRGACNLTTKDYNRLFVQVLGAARKAEPQLAGHAVVHALAGQEADSRRWPDDVDFMRALTEPGIYHRMVRARLRSLLVGLENTLRLDGKVEPGSLLSSSDQKLNIEHLLPQNWQKHWSLGEEASEEALLRRSTAVHKLGNLTLTTTKLNSSLSNNPWEKKREDIRRYSLLRLTTDSVLCKPPRLEAWTNDQWAADWNEERIDLRTLYLTSVALNRWARPDTPEESH